MWLRVGINSVCHKIDGLQNHMLIQIQAVFFIMMRRKSVSKIYKVKVKFGRVQKLVINENDLEIDISINVLTINGSTNKEIIKK
jgi:hypothetical protein